MPVNTRFRVSLTVDIEVAAPFVKNGVPDQILLARLATFKVCRAGSNLNGITMTWVPAEEKHDV